MIRPLIAALLFVMMQTLTAQSMQIEVIPLNHSTTDQIIPVIRPLLTPGGTVSGMNDQLVVKTTPSNLAEIKQVLGSIDSPLRNLMITVQQGADVSRSVQGGGISGNIQTGNGRLSSGGGSGMDGNVIRFDFDNREASSNSSNTYSVRTLEGEPAFIRTGVAVTVPNSNTVITRNGVVVQNSTDYHEAESGFYVLPRISGDRVTLMVAPRQSSVNPGVVPTFNVQNVRTTVSGRLGEWISIGGVDLSESRSGSTLSGGGRREVSDQRSVLIKVDEIR